MRNKNSYSFNGIDIFIFGLFLPMIFFGSCRVNKESAQNKMYRESREHAKLLEETRAAFPCDTSNIVITKTDTAYVFLADTTYSHDTAFVTKTKTVVNTVYRTATVVDSAYGKLWQDRYDQAGYLLQNANDRADNIAAKNTVKDLQIESLKPWRTRAILTWIILGIGIVGLGYLKLKP